MSLLRDPLLLTLLASSLAHGTAFVLQPATTTAPTATVRSGRTAIRLQPSLAAPPPPLLKTPIAHSATPDTVQVDQHISSEQFAFDSDSPARNTPRISPPSRPPSPPLTSPSITPAIRRPKLSKRDPIQRVAPPPTAPPPHETDTNFSVVRKPHPIRIATDSSQPVTTLPRRPTTPPGRFRPNSAPRTRAPATTAFPTPNSPRPQTPPRPRPKQPAPAPSIAQPASRQDYGGPRSLPTALPNNPLPVYPAAAANRRRQGTVIVSMVINADGRVSAATVHRTSGHTDLDAAAIAAARQWTFRPAQRAGEAVGITVLKPFRFVLESR